MNSWDSRTQVFEPGILVERVDSDRLVVWIPVDSEAGDVRWDRVGSVQRVSSVSEGDVVFISATFVPARIIARDFLRRIIRSLRAGRSDRSLSLPDGRLVEPCGKRRTDVVLVWSADASRPLDEARARAHWPECESARKLGENLFAVYGVGRAVESDPAPPPSASTSSSTPTPRSLAERALSDAVKSGDRRAEAVALSDLGFIALTDGDAASAATTLEQALTLALGEGNHAQAAELLGNLALATSMLGQTARAVESIDQGIAEARASGDPFAEKMILERKGQVEASLGELASARASFERALGMARKVGDHYQEGILLWRLGVVHAALGDRDSAMNRCSEAIGLFRSHGRPHADWFAQHLDRYRNDPSFGLTSPMMGPDGGSTGRGAATSPTSPAPGAGPGLLQMALSASKAMANFVASGMTTAPSELRDRRLATCRACEHHTGIRCRLCGCFTELKARLDGEACPIGKW